MGLMELTEYSLQGVTMQKKKRSLKEKDATHHFRNTDRQT